MFWGLIGIIKDDSIARDKVFIFVKCQYFVISP